MLVKTGSEDGMESVVASVEVGTTAWLEYLVVKLYALEES